MKKETAMVNGLYQVSLTLKDGNENFPNNQKQGSLQNLQPKFTGN